MKRWLWLVPVLAIAIAWFGWSGTTSAATQDLNVTLQPGESATIPLQLWCLEPGKSFPKAVTGPTGRAPDNVAKVLQAAQTQGTYKSDPYQTQLAVWQASAGTFNDKANAGTQTAQQLVSSSQSIQLSPVPNDALDQAVSQGKVQATVENLTAINDPKFPGVDAYSGTANLVVKNTSNSAVTFTFVDGSVFNPSAGTTDQKLVGVQDTTKQAQLPQAQATTTTTAAAATTTEVATTAATTAPTTEATTAATTAATAEATTTVATGGAAATTPEATSTTTAPSTLPTTGGGPTDPWMLAFLTAGAALVGLGLFGLGRAVNARKQ